jgi:uncharacterized membrane protein HdeD (DUF308 family)
MKNNTINSENDNLFTLKPEIRDVKMNNENISKQNKTNKHWYINLILGISFILAALWVFCNPEITYNTLAIAFSITLLFTGVLEIAASIQNREYLDEWGLFFTIGILDILVSISIIIISQSQIVSETLTLIMGYVFLYRSVKLSFWSTALKNYEARNWGWVLFGSTVGFILSVLLVWNQTLSLSTIKIFTAFALMIIGISEMYFAFVSRKLKKY